MCTCKKQFFLKTVKNVDVIVGDIADSKADAVVIPKLHSTEEMDVFPESPMAPAVIPVRLPLWEGGDHGEILEIKSGYLSGMEIACQRAYDTVDVEAISMEGKPSDLFAAASAVVRSIKHFLDDNPAPGHVTIVCATHELANVYKQAYNYWFAFVKEERIGSSDWEDWKEEK